MDEPLIYVDTSVVRDGALEELKPAIEELAGFVAVNEPALLAYAVYLSGDGARMTVLHVHADSASLEYHMDVAGPAFRRFATLLTLTSIRVYGEPSERAVMQLHEKAELLGCRDVSVDRLYAGFTRFAHAAPSSGR